MLDTSCGHCELQYINTHMGTIQIEYGLYGPIYCTNPQLTHLVPDQPLPFLNEIAMRGEVTVSKDPGRQLQKSTINAK